MHNVIPAPGRINIDHSTYAERLRRAKMVKNIKGLIVSAFVLAAMSIAGGIETGGIYVP